LDIFKRVNNAYVFARLAWCVHRAEVARAFLNTNARIF